MKFKNSIKFIYTDVIYLCQKALRPLSQLRPDQGYARCPNLRIRENYNQTVVDAPDPDFTYTGISFFLFDLNRLIKVRQQIDEQLRAVGQLENGQKSTEWENQVFQRSKSREEYIKLVATLILKLRDYGKKVSYCF